MKAKYRELIIALADNNMRVKPTARQLQRHYNTVYNQVMLIFRETGYMLDRIVHAPTEIHRDMSVVLIMPFLREKIRREKTNAVT